MNYLVIALVLLASPLLSQPQTLSVKPAFELEIDPLAYALKGYSLHGIVQLKQTRFDLGTYGIETPGKLTGNEGFSVRTTGFGIKVNQLFGTVKGVYTGIDFGYAETTAIHEKTQLQDQGHSLSLGAHLGYRYFPFLKKSNALRGIYLTPWAGISYTQPYDKINLTTYTNNRLGYFAALHLGYRFNGWR
ncbi:MAG: hypothetical protein L6Q78_08855 [Bacteroidia bacterium]|nr:hypothetical protein [Bacteroidia bacterium]